MTSADTSQEPGIDWLGDLEEETRRRLPSDEKVETLEKLAEWYEKMAHDIEVFEEALAERKEAFRFLREDTIPDKMMEFGVKKLVLSDGSELSYLPFYGGSVAGEGAYDWLEQEGYPDAVKQELKLETSRVDKETIELIKNFIVKRNLANLSLKEKQSVHHMTLGAIIRELNKEGKSLPSDLFNVYIGNRATLKKGKPEL